MVDQLTLQTIGILLTGLTVSIAAIYYTLTLRYTRRNQDLQLETRQAQLFMQLYSQFRTKEFQQVWTEIRFWEWGSYDEYLEKYGPQTNPEAYSLMMSIVNFFDGVGMLVKRELIDMSFVEEMFSNHIILFWRKLEPIIKEARERQLSPLTPPRPRIWEMVEYLYDEVIKYEEELELKT